MFSQVQGLFQMPPDNHTHTCPQTHTINGFIPKVVSERRGGAHAPGFLQQEITGNILEILEIQIHANRAGQGGDTCSRGNNRMKASILGVQPPKVGSLSQDRLLREALLSVRGLGEMDEPSGRLTSCWEG